MNGQSKIVELLMKKSTEYNFKFNAKGEDGKTALHWASKNGHLKIVKMLKEKSTELNLDLNAKDALGWTALKYAGFHK